MSIYDPFDKCFTDCSYIQCMSPLVPAGSLVRPMFFEVSKKEGGTGQEVIEVTIPRELRGRSEIAVFISDQPVKGLFGPFDKE